MAEFFAARLAGGLKGIQESPDTTNFVKREHSKKEWSIGGIVEVKNDTLHGARSCFRFVFPRDMII